MEFILTILITLIIILLFRRIDKSNLKINKVKRFAEKAADDLNKMLQNKKQEIHDVTIDLDILLKRTTLSVEDLEKKWNNAQIIQNNFIEKEENLNKVEEQVKVLNQLSVKTNENIEFLKGDLKLLYTVQNDLNGLSTQVKTLEKQLIDKGDVIISGVKERITLFEKESNGKILKVNESLDNKLSKFSNFIKIREEEAGNLINVHVKKIKGLNFEFSKVSEKYDEKFNNYIMKREEEVVKLFDTY